MLAPTLFLARQGPLLPKPTQASILDFQREVFIEGIDGKPFFIENFSLSDDGNTLTDDANMANANEPVKAVYERQK